jgi:hypothetical protein
MQASNKGTPQAAADSVAASAALASAFHGALGFVVRCTPRRITRMCPFGDGFAFAKLRSSRAGDAVREWHWLHELPRLGIPAPPPLAFLKVGRSTGLLTGEVAGRPLDAWIDAAVRGGGLADLAAFALRTVAPKVARLHASGLVYRDLYWNHIVAAGIDEASDVTFLDVERVFAPRFRFERWRIKDLAGLASSFPGDLPLRLSVRFLRAYLAAGPGLANDRRVVRQVLRSAGKKARRIRAHTPKFG